MSTVLSEPRLLATYARNGLAHRVIGPMLSPWRPGGVAVFHIGSCGSTVLSDLLDQHPRIYWDGETYGRVIFGIKQAGRSRAEVSFDPVRYVERRLSRSGNRWYGYDLKFSHITEFGVSVEDYVDAIRRVGVSRFMLLRRRNYLRRVVSGVNGGRRGQYHHRGEAPSALEPFSLELEDLTVDLYRSSLVEHFERWDRLYDQVERLAGTQGVTVTYEEHIAPDPSIAYDMVRGFLGLSPHEPRVRLRRANPEPLAQLLTNMDEVRAYLAGTPYEWMAQE